MAGAFSGEIAERAGERRRLSKGTDELVGGVGRGDAGTDCVWWAILLGLPLSLLLSPPRNREAGAGVYVRV